MRFAMTGRRNSFSMEDKEWRHTLWALIRENWANWLSLTLLTTAFLFVRLGTSPVVRRISPNAWEDLKYPYDPHNTVPSFLVPIYGLLIPFLLALTYYIFTHSEIREFHDLVYSVLINQLITALATDTLKISIGRLRPNFFERCYGDSISLTEQLAYENYTPPECTQPDRYVIENGRRSFPSGHTSWAASSMFYITLFMIGKFQVFDGRGHVWKLLVSIFPSCCAVAIGITRINDYAHHWTDVVAGLLLGMTIATTVYLMYYPWPFARTGAGIPLYQTHQRTNRASEIGVHEPDETTVLTQSVEEGLSTIQMVKRDSLAKNEVQARSSTVLFD